MTPEVLLVNTNIARPPVSPVGLEYAAQALIDAGAAVRVLDLSFETDWAAGLKRELRDRPLLVGLTVRNTDDCSYKSKKSFLPWTSQVVAGVRSLTDAPVFLGGVGFSTMPETVLRITGADGGIAGDAEAALPALVRCLARGEDYSSLPNLVAWRDGRVVLNPRADVDLRFSPAPRRRVFDNRSYEQLGAMVGVETKRGCSQRCIFCADPVAKGRAVRLRPPQTVARELRDLVEQGVTWFHLCDSEFNLPPEHAREVCRAIVREGLSERIRWYCYCSPVPFDRELARLMVRAGCAGVNFGVDSMCDEQLSRLGRAHSAGDVHRLTQLLNSEKVNYIFDLLVGGPGESPDTVATTVSRTKEYDVPLVGIAYGVRVYPGTPLAEALSREGIAESPPERGQGTHRPFFYLSPLLGGEDDVRALLDRLAAGDSRFLLLSAPAEKGSYNYADDTGLCQLIKRGARGAYWDILRRAQNGV